MILTTTIVIKSTLNPIINMGHPTAINSFTMDSLYIHITKRGNANSATTKLINRREVVHVASFFDGTIRMRWKFPYFDAVLGKFRICSSAVKCSNFGNFQIFLKIPISRSHLVFHFYWRDVVRANNIPQRGDSDAREIFLDRGVFAKVSNSP